MYYKLSNTAGRKRIEKEAQALFKYPNLYTPQIVISGLTEVSIPVLTMEEENEISWAIWGMLPENCKEDWEFFQEMNNTLNVHVDLLTSDFWFSESLQNKRCLVPVTGYFTYLLREGEVFPYFIGDRSGTLMFLAGIYTILDDGFITCTLLTGEIDQKLKKYQNLVNYSPIIIDEEYREQWLSTSNSVDDAHALLKTKSKTNLKASPIAKELFNQGITYDSMLLPFDYFDAED